MAGTGRVVFAHEMMPLYNECMEDTRMEKDGKLELEIQTLENQRAGLKGSRVPGAKERVRAIDQQIRLKESQMTSGKRLL